MLAQGLDWELDVGRGPGWLFVKVKRPSAEFVEMRPLVDTLRLLLEESLTYRLVLELAPVEQMTEGLVGELRTLDQWIRARSGVLRICGLSARNQQLLDQGGLDRLVYMYRDRFEAVFGSSSPPRVNR